MDIILLGLIPETLFFSFAMLNVKGIKSKRTLFTIVMAIIYVGLGYLFSYDLLFNFMYIAINYFVLKYFYKDRIQVTDIFLFMILSIIVIISSTTGYILSYITIQSLHLASILKIILMTLTFYMVKDKLSIFYKIYYEHWNRKPNLKMKSLTVRNISIICFNVSLAIIGTILTFKIYFESLGMR